MNTKNNKRRKESQLKIEQTFIKLLETKELNHITVTQLCQLTKLNRSTFYANYLDVYDLADKVKERLNNEIMGLYQKERLASTHSYDYLPLLKHIYLNQSAYKTYFKLGCDPLIDMQQYSKEHAIDAFNHQFVEYHLEFFKSGFASIIKMWLNKGCIETPEEIISIIQSEYQGRKRY